jgi:hypothetical protein
MIQRRAGKRPIDGKDFHLADEVRYIQRRAAEHDGRFVTIASLVLFSTETGDAWLLDPTDRLAARLARDGDPEDLYLEETETRFAIGWKGNYRIEGESSIRQALHVQQSLALFLSHDAQRAFERRRNVGRPLYMLAIAAARAAKLLVRNRNGEIHKREISAAGGGSGRVQELGDLSKALPAVVIKDNPQDW